MSPRRNRRVEPAPLAGSPRRTVEKVESWPDGDWTVRSVAGSADGKTYRCPGCDQEIPSSVGHLVCWSTENGGVAHRRHWHRPCWQARLRRAPRVLRSRGAPRY
ncbi:MAG TPA: ATP/GTP-binding protein [Micromonosporaceae bacterium]|nr:ATP/GTP-binding protein [Micromonosporaceae bacterium]